MILEIKSDPAELKNVRKNIEIFCKENVLKIDIFEVKLAIDEALQNIIRHAYDFSIITCCFYFCFVWFFDWINEF